MFHLQRLVLVLLVAGGLEALNYQSFSKGSECLREELIYHEVAFGAAHRC